jgi:hypothetical protein
MAVSLAQAKLNAQDKVVANVIDEFRKSNFLFDNMIFDDCVSPSGGGSTLTYGYTRVVTQPTAAFRAVNNEFQAQEAQKQRYTTDLKIFGGSFAIDRVISDMSGIIDEVSFQTNQKVKAAAALFNDTCINGDSAIDADAFDGLEKAITGSSTEYIPNANIVLDTSANVTANYMAFLDQLDEFLSGLDGVPSCIAGNTKLISKLRAVARRAGMYSTIENTFNQKIELYGNVPFVDLGTKAGSNAPVVGIDGATGLTSLYAIRLGLDGFHAVSLKGESPVKIWLPDYSTAGAVKTGEVELVAAVVLKATKAAGIMRNIKVQ